jgi:hypothetical protein
VNRKFELFLDDLFDLGFDNTRIKKELTLYMYKVESYYSEKTRELYERKKRSSSTPRIQEDPLDKNELLKHLNRSVEEARKQILRRRVKQEIVN